MITQVSHAPALPQDGDDLTVTVNASDPDGAVAQVTLHWRYGDTVTFDTVAATPAGGDAYDAVIGPLVGGNRVEYYVEAMDDEGAVATSPAAAPAGSRVKDGDTL